MGARGAAARMIKMTPERRREVAQIAAAVRWTNHVKKADQPVVDLQTLLEIVVRHSLALDTEFAELAKSSYTNPATVGGQRAGVRELARRITAELTRDLPEPPLAF